MHPIVIFLLVIIGIIALLILGYFMRLLLDKHSRDNCNSLVEFTRQFAEENLGFIRVISGKIRIGKTTFASGLIHLDELNLIDQIDNDISDIKEILHELDFLAIDEDILNQYELHHDRFKTFKYISKKYSVELDDKYYDNYLKVINYYQLLEKYIYAIFRKIDNNYVMSNVDKHSFITGNMAKKFNPEFLKIREDNKEYPIVRYMSILEDEKLLSTKVSNNVTSNFENDGTSVFLRLIGQIGKESIYYTTTAQNALRWVKSEREIATSIIYINERAVIGNLPTLSRHYEKKKRRNAKREYRYARRHFKKDPEAFEAFLNNDNKFKVKNMILKDKLNKIFSESYLKYSCTIYRKIDDVGKAAKDANGALTYDFVYPLRWCFGSLDSHFFSFIQDYLEGYKKSKYYDMANTDINPKELAKAILAKPIKAKTKSEEKKGDNNNDSTKQK